MSQASRDQNFVPTLLGVSNADGVTPVRVYADPVTHRLLVDSAGGGTGTVTSVSVVSANGFAGTVATATTTPAITLSTTITGILKGNGTAISAATAGSDYTALAFKTISVSGQSDVVADSAADTLTLVAGSGMTITTNASTDTITFVSSGGGGTPGGSDTQVQFNDAGSFGGDAHFVWDKTGTGKLTVGGTDAVGTNGLLLGAGKYIQLNDDQTNNYTQVAVQTSQVVDTIGTQLAIFAGGGNGVGTGGTLFASGGTGGATGDGGQLRFFSGDGGATSGSGGTIRIQGGTAQTGSGGNLVLTGGSSNVSGDGGSFALTGGNALGTGAGGSATFRAGDSSNGNGGSVSFRTGSGNGGGTNGIFQFLNPSGFGGILNFSAVTLADKTFTFPNLSGNIAVIAGTLAIPSGKTATISNTLTFTGTDGSSVAFGTGGTVLYANQSITLSGDVTGSGTTAITTTVAKIAGTTVSGTTGTGNVVFATTPTLTTPVLGVATATTINKVTLTAPATGSTLTILDGKTLTANNTIVLAAGADSQTFTFPAASATVAGLGTTQTFTGQDKFNNFIDVNNAVSVTTNAGTVPVTFRLNTFTNSSAATMAITMATASAVDGQMSIVRIYDFSGVAQTIGWTNTENSTVTVPTTSNGSATLPLTVGFMFNSATSLWRCIAKA